MITKANRMAGVSESTAAEWRVIDGFEPIRGEPGTITSCLKDIVEIPTETMPAAESLNAVKDTLTGWVLAGDLSQDELDAIHSLYPQWAADHGEPYPVDTLLSWGNKLYRVIQQHTPQVDWEPQLVPALFAVTAPAGVIPDWVQPLGAHDAYQIGDRVMFEGAAYESLIDANSWSPSVHPAGWKAL